MLSKGSGNDETCISLNCALSSSSTDGSTGASVPLLIWLDTNTTILRHCSTEKKNWAENGKSQQDFKVVAETILCILKKDQTGNFLDQFFIVCTQK